MDECDRIVAELDSLGFVTMDGDLTDDSDRYASAAIALQKLLKCYLRVVNCWLICVSLRDGRRIVCYRHGDRWVAEWEE